MIEPKRGSGLGEENHGNRWSANEIKTLKDNYKKIGVTKTAKLLHRGHCAVASKADELGLRELSKRGAIKLSNHKAAKNHLYQSYIKMAKKRDYSFGLSQKQFEKLINDNCFYCGQPPLRKYRGYVRDLGLSFNGVDRMNNSIGYILENCVSCCTTCNYMKRIMTAEQFLLHIKKIYSFSIKE